MPSLGFPLASPLGADLLIDAGSPEDHVALALSRLVEQFKDKPKIRLLVAVLAQRAQYVERAFYAMLRRRGLAVSVGQQLDNIGDIVKQPRAGLGDDDYRRFLYARIAVDRSEGPFEDLITVTRLVLGDPSATVTIRNEGTATVVARIGGIALTLSLATILAKMLRAATAAAKRILTEFSESVPANTFRFDSGPGLDVGHLAGALEVRS